MVEAKVTACAKIPKELYEESIQKYSKISIAIIAGLELLRDKKSIQNSILNQNSIPNSIPNVEAQLENQKENERLQEINEILKKELEQSRQDKELRILQEQENHKERISDLKEQINSLHEQIKIKDEQLRTKDDQIEKLNENMHGQVANIYNLTKENTKLLPENKERKKWLAFWLN